MGLHRNLKPWQPGQSGNLNGRPVGSRTAFSAGFLKDLVRSGRRKAVTPCELSGNLGDDD